MSDRLCAQLAAWGSAWLQGSAGFDEVLDAVTCHGRHQRGPGYADEPGHPLGAILTDWKRAGAQTLRLALPIPGDVRGVGGPAEFRSAALSAGQAVFGAGFGLTVLHHASPSSAGDEFVWHRAEAGDIPPDPVGLADADHDLTEAIRETASSLARHSSARWITDVGAGLANARRAGERLDLPSSHPPRAVRLLAQAERLTAVLQVVDTAGGVALSASQSAERTALLSPLRIAVRRALLAGYNAPAEVAAN